MRRLLPIFVVAVLLAMPCLAIGQASGTTGEIRGTVYDEQGALVTNAKVVVKNTATGITRDLVTDERGRFRALLLQVGTYEITVEKERFRQSVRSGIEVKVGDVINLDFTLEVGEFTNVITITGDAPVVEVSRTQVSDVIAKDLIENLPINGRDYRDFVLVTPTTGVSYRGGVTMGGSRGMYTNMTIDGADNNSPFFSEQNGGEIDAGFTTSQESVKEFRVLSSGFSAEFGRSIGGLINVVTKSGTNELRGTGFFFGQNESFVTDQQQATNYGADTTLVPQKEFHRYQYGGSVGGPIQKDKAFFFLSTDVQNYSIPRTVRFTWSDADRAANPEIAALEGENKYNTTDDDTVVFGKLDYELSDNHSLTVRYSWSDVAQENGIPYYENNSVSTQGKETERSTSLVASLTSFLSETMINELRFQYANDDIHRGTNETVLPQIRVDGVGYWGSTWYLPIQVKAKRYQLTDNFNWLFTDHDVKFGIDFNRTTTEEIFIGNSRGQLRFTSLANYLNDNIYYVYQRIPLGGRTMEECGQFECTVNEIAFYVQDKWQPTQRLTIDAGVRWEGTYNPNPPTTNPLFPLTGQLYDDTNNWAPRFGIAYDLFGDGKTVIRGAGGLFYGRTPSIIFYNPFNGNGVICVPFQYVSGSIANQYYPPYDAQGIIDLYASGGGKLDIDYVDPDFQEAEVWRVNAGLEHELVRNTSISFDLLYANGDKLFGRYDSNLADPIAGASVQGRNLYSTATRPNSNFGRIQETISQGNMEYWAFTAMLKSRIEDISGQVSYTWSRDKDDTSSERDSGGITYTEPFNPSADWGLSDRDRTHRLVASVLWNAPFDFVVSGILVWQSGQPYSALWGLDLNGDGQTNDRAAPGSGGTVWVERNSYRVDAYKNLDLRISKIFRIDRFQIEGIFEAFNLFNWKSITSVYTDARYTSFGLPSTYQNSRRLQLGARIRF
jgi:hypothetical protein